MSKKEKLLIRFFAVPKDFTFEELVSLLAYFNYFEAKTGKTAGSRVKFVNDKYLNRPIRVHKPHPRNILLEYQIKQVIEVLKEIEKEETEDEKKKK